MRTWSVMLCVAGLAAAAARADQAQTQPASPQTQPAAPAAPAAAFDPARSDEKAIAIVDKLMAALGADAFAKTPFLKFTFVVRRGEARPVARTHYWDKPGGRSRMEWPDKEGRRLVAIVNHLSREGQATIDGQLLFDVDARKYVESAYGSLINDSYWLFMQFKLKDPGVRLRYDGELKAGQVIYDKIQVSFDDGIGLTPKDRYWLYINRANNLIERWSYVLTNDPPNTTPIAWEWTDWKEVGGMKLATRKTQTGGEVDILLENVEAYPSLPDSVFTSTAPVDPGAAQPAAP